MTQRLGVVIVIITLRSLLGEFYADEHNGKEMAGWTSLPVQTEEANLSYRIFRRDGNYRMGGQKSTASITGVGMFTACRIQGGPRRDRGETTASLRVDEPGARQGRVSRAVWTESGGKLKDKGWVCFL